ncbi:AgmX/PglI C-terminal domain-containing protein [Myxococcota bacterium]|nr:AgmX/PglI C-terminal domain-containing protein [Myxococcota bacterium]MBU1534742.1 AgmX/PglI C-terminal domain-containing protein [Myxococcota bacterium]
MKNSNQNQTVTIRIYRKDSREGLTFLREEQLSDETIKIGKGTAATLRIEDESVALMHAFITREPSGSWVLSDVTAGNGTLVNGRSAQRTILGEGDEISLGNMVLLFSAAACSVEEAPLELARVKGAGALLITTREENQVVKKSVITARRGSKKLAFGAMVFGVLIMLVGAYLGYASVDAVHEEMKVNAIIKDIAKEQGLSDKFIPKARGNDGFAISSVLLFVLGSFGIFMGMASLYRSSRTKDRFTVGEDPAANFSMNSRGLPVELFPMAECAAGALRVNIPDAMEFSLLRNNEKRLMPDLTATVEARPSESYPGTMSYDMKPGEKAVVSYRGKSWEIVATDQPALLLPLSIPREVFHLQIMVWIVVMAGLGFYFAHLQRDELFQDTRDMSDASVRAFYKSPALAAKQLKEQKKAVDLKVKEAVKNIYKPTASKDKNNSPSVRDPRNNAKTAGSQGNTNSSNTLNGPTGAGVMNVLASNLSTMTASLTASNTVFGQETEEFNDYLGDGDPDGEMMSDSLMRRGGPGGSPGNGGLGIPGNGMPGWGGLEPNGTRWTPSGFNPGPGITRRTIRTRDGKADVFGKLDPNEVRQVIRNHRSQVHHCYQKGLLADNNLRGVIRISFFINISGRAQSCAVTDNLAIPTVGSCICASVVNWKFPQPQGGLARISYSWTLSPGN